MNKNMHKQEGIVFFSVVVEFFHLPLSSARAMCIAAIFQLHISVHLPLPPLRMQVAHIIGHLPHAMLRCPEILRKRKHNK